MALSNPFETIVHHLLIEGITYLSHQDGFPMVSVLVYMVTRWTRLTMSHNMYYRVIMTSLSYYIA